jgi:hypothetical protein
MTQRKIVITIIFFKTFFTYAIDSEIVICKSDNNKNRVCNPLNDGGLSLYSGDTNRFLYISLPPLRPLFAQSVISLGIRFDKWMAEMQSGVTYGEPFIRPLSTYTNIYHIDMSGYDLPFGESIRAISWYGGLNGSRTLFNYRHWSIGLPIGYNWDRRLYSVYSFPDSFKYIANPTIRVLKRDWHRVFTGIKLLFFPKKQNHIFHELSFLMVMSVVKDYYIIMNNTVSRKSLLFSELYFEMTYSLAFRWKPKAWRKRMLVE